MSDDNNCPDKTAEVAGKAIAAVAGAAVGGPVGAVVAVALEPLLERFVAEAWREIGLRRQQSVGLMVQGAAERLEIPPDELIARSLESEDRSQLLADAMYQSAQTFNLQKIHALARAVANGLHNDQARADEEILIVSALASIEAAHVKVLLALPDQRSRPSVSTTGIRSRTVSTRGATMSFLAEESGMRYESAQHVLAELVRTGMAVVDDDAGVTRHDRLIIELQDELNKLQKLVLEPNKKPTGGSKPRQVTKPGSLPRPGYAISSFGRLCLAYLLDAEAPSADETNEPADSGEDLDAPE